MDHPHTLLVVEDDGDLRRMYRTALGLAGFEVREAPDGLSALHRIDEHVPDVIVLDLMLPRITGYGVLHDLKTQAQTRSIPVVVVTGTTDEVEHGNVACVLRKPVSPDQLVDAVRRCLEKGSP